MNPVGIGANLGFHGVTEGPSADGAEGAMGPWLEEDDATVFQEFEGLIKRQELLAINRWNIDEYFRTVVNGYPWATLIHDTGRDTYTFSLPYNTSTLSIQAIPNKNLDLVNKASEQLMVDFPQVECEPIDDSEESEQAAEMANRFLEQDAGEDGTNDAVLFDDRLKLALVTSTTYVEVWADPTGGGYVPLQIKAHPQAVSPDNPLVGPDGMPTTDYVLRYVAGGQFTDDPSKADPQWQPKLVADKWQREHLRVFPENLPIERADKAIVLGYCTIGQAKTRWESIQKMAPEDLSALCDWTPPRYQLLLPPFQRARWQLGDDWKQKNKSGASDERIMFYYHGYQKATPEYPKGADVVVTGALDCLVIDRQLLSADVEVEKGQGTVKETRCREIPIVAITPRGDPTGQDPTGRCYLEMAVGATEWNAMLAQSFGRQVEKGLTQPYVQSVTSAISGQKVEVARTNGDFLKVIDMAKDMPRQLELPELPHDFFQMFGLTDEAINSIMNTERAATGDLQGAKERSGKAISLAIGQNNMGHGSRQNAFNNAYTRFNRIKCEIVMSKYSTPQMLSYVGEDGASKQEEFSGVDFARIGKVRIKTGTGTGQAQDQKVNTLGTLAAEGFISREEAADSARPILSKRMGLPSNPFEQYVERAVASWLDGPPEPKPADPSQVDPMTGQPMQPPTWEQEYATWKQADDQFKQQTAQFQQQQQVHQQFLTLSAQADAGKPTGTLGPEAQDEKAKFDFANAQIQLATMTAQNPNIAQQPVAPQPPQVPKPWTPFTPRPIDTMPAVAAIWVRKLSRQIATVKYNSFGPEWRDVLDQAFTAARQAAATASAGIQQPDQSQQGKPPTKPQQPTQSAQHQPA